MKICPRCLSALLLATTAQCLADDPLLSSWKTGSSGQYARVYQGSSATALDTWPTGTSGQVFGGQSSPAYSDVERVAYSASFVYVSATGLASYTMGPWYNNAAKTILFQNWPADQGLTVRLPRTPAVATAPTATRLGAIGLAVNGVVFYNGQDAFSYSASAGADETAPQGDGYWNRDALLTEAVTFDPALAHQQNTGQYHYHVNPVALRYQLGDHVTYSNAAYAESAAAPAHSPLLGWGFDGIPVYGPYGYASALDPTSGVRRMVGGFVKRDGTHGTTNLSATGRTTLPNWAVASQSRSTAALTSAQAGPAVSTSRPLGYYQEDYDYLGDHGYTQGVDFDLDLHNARYAVTPEYPNGTWAYFISIDAAGSPAFPYVIGPQYKGVASGGTVTTISETVTEYARGGAAAPIAVTAVGSGSGVLLSWTSVEGGSYLVESSANGTSWTTVATNVASAGLNTTYSLQATSGYFRVTLSALASYDTAPSGAVAAVGGSGTAQVVGSSGTCYLVNVSALTAVGGQAGSPTIGFYVSGTGAKHFLARAVGPTLSTFSVANPLADPTLQLYSGSTAISSAAGWDSSLASAFAAVGAFALPAGSRDSALSANLQAGGYTTPVSSVSGGAGSVLLELYDQSPGSGSPRLINLSARGYASPGSSLTAGFVIGGTGTAQVLIRGVGPALASYGVSGLLQQPQLTLYENSAPIAANSGWSGASNAAAIAAAEQSAGAFALPSGSADCAILTSLAPGLYTAGVTGSGNTSGTALVEIYLLD